MKNIKAFIKSHSAWAYFVLTFLISWGGVLLVTGGVSGIPANAEQVKKLLPLVVLTLTIGPILTSLVLIGIIDGRSGFRTFLSRLFRWQVSVRWYIIALLITPVFALITLLALSFFSPIYIPGIFASKDRATLLVSALAAGLTGGLLEEPGWTGFAIPKLRMRYSVFATGLIVGLLWGAWHFIAAFWGSGTPTGEFSLLLFLPQFLFYIAVLPPYRMLMVWVYDQTESLLIAMLMHASLTGSILFIFMPLSISGTPLLIWYLVLAIAFWVAVAIVFLPNRKSLEKDRKG
ncbi:MAG: CPBP family intramembrane metalloprotease [Anaerolineales bacterium]|nr:CPBP family intramembrane metalloprotease [Anaerolineales bacterium]